MGVTGLWQLISSTGKPVPLESLEGKVLAVDVSVWLHQLSKGMRDGSGNPVPNAHLHGLFTRICKLLHCRIKPVFVFDGGVPALKKQTLANRKSRREDAEKSSELMQQKILTNLIRSQVLQTAAGDGLGPIGPYYTKPKTKGDKDAIFELPPIPESSKRYLNENLHQEDAFVERRELQALIEEEYEDVNQINVESEDFKSLPAEIQHEIIYDIQQNRKNYNMSKIAELPSDSNDFSSYQMSKLLKHSKLHTRLEEVRKEINNRQTQDLSKYYSKDIYGANVQSHRLVSDETSHVLLIKGLKNKQKNVEEEERKKQREKEKRRKNMKLLEKVFPGMSEESSYRDELLHDSDHEDIKQLDFLHVSQERFSEKIIPQTNKPEQVPLVDKPRFKAKIEIDSDSSDEEDMLIQNVTKCKTAGTNETGKSIRDARGSKLSTDTDAIIIDDDIHSEDEDLQRAIELSLQQNIDNTASSDMSSGRNSHNSVDTDNKGHNKAYMKDDHDTEKLPADRENIKRRILDEKTIKNNSKNIPKITNKSLVSETEDRCEQIKSKKHIKMKPSRLQTRRRLKVSKGQTQRIQALRSGSQALIFKRQLSNLSNEEFDDVMMTDQSQNKDNDGTEDDPTPSTVVDIDSDQTGDNTDDDQPEVASDSSDNEFIEVKIDPGDIKEDSLFPSSMFENIAQKGQKLSPVRIDSSSDESSSRSTVSDERHNDVKESPKDKIPNTDSESLTLKDDTLSVAKNEETKLDKNDGFSITDKINDNADGHGKRESQKKYLDMEVIEDKMKEDNSKSIEISNTMEDSSLSKDTQQAGEADSDGLTLSQGSVGSSEKGQGDERELTLLSQGSEGSSAEVLENMGSPRPSGKDLAKEFQAMDEIIMTDSSWRLTLKNLGNANMEWNIRGLRDGLAKEEKKLLQERGKQERLAMSITDQMHTEAQELLQLFGIPYIVSPTEAEAQCAQLDYSKQTQGTITDDSDIWLFGGTCVYKNFFNQQKYVECFKIESIKSKLGLTRQSLINIALLCGSDYTDGIQGVGPVTAMEILAEFPGEDLDGLTDFRAWWEKAQTDIRVKNEKKFRMKLRDLEIKEGFPHPNVVEAYLNPTVDDSSEKFTWGIPDLDQLRQFATDKLGWTKVKVEETLQPVLKRMTDRQNQMRISAYFQPEIYMQPAKVKSKRLQNVVDKFLGVDTGQSDKEPAKPDKGKKSRGKKAQKVNIEVDNQGNEDDENLDEDKSSCKTENNQTNTDNIDESHGKRGTVGKKGKALVDKDKTRGRQIKSSNTKTGDTQRASTSSKQTEVVVSSDYSSDSDSDSGSSSADSDSDVVETGLQVSEILGLTIGPGQNLLDINEPSKVRQKVFVSGLNVDEILNLDSGEVDCKGCEKEENVLEQWDSALKSSNTEDPNRINIDNNESSKSDDVSKDIDFTNEGGFLREDSYDSDTNNTVEKDENNIEKCEKCPQHVKGLPRKRKSEDKDSSVEQIISRRRTRTRNMDTIQDTEEDAVNISDNKNDAKNNKSVIRKQSETKRNTRASKNKSSDINIEDMVTEAESENYSKVSNEPSNNSKVKIEKMNEQSEALDRESGQGNEIPTYTDNPIKKLLTGVPWENRGAKRGRSTKGHGKVKVMKVEPTENLQKKKKNVKVTRKAIGVVNLSESSSDSN